MPLYDVACDLCGVSEVHAHISEAGDLKCPHCKLRAQQYFSPASLPMMQMEAGGEDSPLPDRQRDGTAIFNVGLPPVDTVVGTRQNGKPAIASRPRTNNEIGSNKNAREIAKRAGLEPMSKGRYRAIGR